MSPEAQRIAIAEACGWKNLHLYYSNLQHASLPAGYAPDDPNDVTLLPDYLADLNAMHEALNLLGDCEIKWRQYKDWLYVICEPHRHALHATAPQQAKALLKTLGKWDDAK